MPSKYSIKDLELMSGIKAHTLRIWELRYNILEPQRTTTNIRYYNNADLRRILNISILNKNGHKISSIAGLSDQVIVQKVEKYLNDYLKENNKIESLYMALLDMDEDRFEGIINSSVIHFGFENTIEKIIFPFLRHLGNMWQLSAISSAQEHYVSNLIRQKLIVGLDKLAPEENTSAKTFLFFLPNNELHEMGLLYAYYLAKAKGHKCFYLGQSVPLEDLLNISQVINPDYLLTILTNGMPDEEINDFLKQCGEGLEKPRFLISGRLLIDKGEQITLPSGRFSIFQDFEELKKWF